MGRPREHDARTRAALLGSAERIVTSGGVGALSVRAVADAAGTTTRAVYSLFGSKDGLVSALMVRTFEMLAAMVESSPSTDDPAADVVELAAVGYRGFVIAHPSLYRLAFHRIAPEAGFGPEVAEARRSSFASLVARLERLDRAGGIGRRTAVAAAVEVNALCEGLANAELRGGSMRRVEHGEDDERTWREAFTDLLQGLRATGAPRRRPTRSRRR